MLSRQGNLFRRQTGFEQKEDFRMKFLDKLRAGIAHFMSGRYGTDQLGFTMVITALIVTFIGAITQAPVAMGASVVELACKAAKGETVEDVDSGCQWYTAENMNDEEIAQNLYD